MDEASFNRAIQHLAELGDTDILPPLFEFQFYADASEPVVKKLTAYQFGTYKPVGAFEVLSPKTQTSFRIAHQLYSTDCLLYTAAAIDIAPALEERRGEIDKGAFSYRFDAMPNAAALFAEGCSYHDWLINVSEMCSPADAFDPDKLVVETDISDFYGRIYFHRIEHVLDDIKAKNSSRTIIENVIKNSRARQSYGLPVGSAASRIIAEGVLIDIDEMLRNQPLIFTRYVDDFKIIVENSAAAHTALCRLAEHLMLTEGLSLNAAKTKITPGSVIIKEIESQFSEVFTEEERKALDRYIQAIYDGEDIADAIISSVDADILESKVDFLVKRDTIDYTSVKLILKALRATGVGEPVQFVHKYSRLLYFIPRDFCILVGSMAQKTPEYADALAEALIPISQQKPYVEMTLARIWVNHLFVSGALAISQDRLTRLNIKDSVIEKRQALLLRGRLKDRAYFREAKTRFSDLSDWEKPAMMLAASCLADSEYETWLGFCKDRYTDILCSEYISWLKKNKDILFEKLNANFVIKSHQQRIMEMFSELDADDVPAF